MTSTKGLDRLDVRRLLSLGSFHDVELYCLALAEGAVAFADDRREVDEHVVAVRASDEAVTLLVAEPLHRSLRQPVPPCTSRRTARQRRRERSMRLRGGQWTFVNPVSACYQSGSRGRP